MTDHDQGADRSAETGVTTSDFLSPESVKQRLLEAHKEYLPRAYDQSTYHKLIRAGELQSFVDLLLDASLVIEGLRQRASGQDDRSADRKPKTVEWLNWPDEVVLRVSPRGDGGLRICSDTLPGLILSHGSPDRAMAAVLPAIHALLANDATVCADRKPREVRGRTPGPWTAHHHAESIGGGGHINGPHHCAIAYVGFGTETESHYVTGEEAKANLDFIVKAANEHDALVYALAARDARITELSEALAKIERWFGEFPPTNQYWEDGDGMLPVSPRREMSYSACFGSNGERDYMRSVARTALKPEGH